jgi:hypothetical protein
MEYISEKQGRILIKENDKSYKSMLAHGLSLCSLVSEVKESYKKTNLGPFENQVYKTLISGGIAGIEHQLITDVTDRYEALNLRSQTMKDEILGDAYSIIEALKRSVERLRQQSRQNGSMGEPAFPLHLISINDAEEAVISEEAKEEVREKCRIYLNSPEEVALYPKLQAAADAINEVWKEVKAHEATNLPLLGGLSGARALIITALWENEQGLYVRPEITGWIVNSYKAKKEQVA